MNMIKEKFNIKKSEHTMFYMLLFVFTFINIFLFSSVSPIHSILNLQYDQLVYHLIGKGMKYGKVPFIDLIDHKGIYLFSIYALGEWICEYKHIGLFVITFILNYVYAVFTYKIAYIFTERKWVSLLTSFFIVALQNTYFLSVNGLDCESIILPFLMIAFYLMFKAIIENEKIYPLRYIYIDGIVFGIILFIKANACFIFAIIAVVVLIEHIEKKEWKHLALTFVFGLLGIVIALIPGIIYCLSTGSFSAMIEHSFIVNLKYVGTGYPGAKDIVDAFLKTFDKLKTFTLIAILSIPALIDILKQDSISRRFFSRKKLFIFYILSMITSIYAVFAACRPYTHYMILLLPYYIFIFIFFIIHFCDIIENKKYLKIIYVVMVIVINVMSYNLNLEIGLMNGAIQQNLCNKMLKTYKKEKISMSKKNPSIFVVGFSMYLYEALNQLPNEKYFATPVVLRKDYSKPYDEVIKHIKSGDEDFICLSYGRAMNLDESFRNEVETILDENYIPVGTFKEIDQQIVMYKRK